MTERAANALAELSINLPSLTVAVRELSGGQRQAVAVARAVMWATTAILLDEPTAALGARQSEIIAEPMRTVAARGLGVLVISHDLPRILEAADTITVLWRGESVLEAPASDLTVPDSSRRWSAIAGMVLRDRLDESEIAPQADDRGRPSAPFWLTWLKTRGAWILLLDLALVAVFTALSPGHVFWSVANAQALLLGMSETLLLALGLAMMLGAGIFDLSLGANLVFSSVVGALAMHKYQAIPGDASSYASPATAILVGLVAAVCAGVAFGLVNGLLIAYGQINSLIATLGTMGIGTGVALLLSGGTDLGGFPSPCNRFRSPLRRTDPLPGSGGSRHREHPVGGRSLYPLRHAPARHRLRAQCGRARRHPHPSVPALTHRSRWSTCRLGGLHRPVALRCDGDQRPPQ